MIDFEEVARRFDQDGYALIENFIPLEWIERLKKEIDSLMKSFDCSKESATIFEAGNEQCATKYFLESSDKIRYFLEKDAWNQEKNCLMVPKEQSLNKIGHAMHWYNETFREFTFQQCFQTLSKSLGLIDPLIVQSLIIFKNPRIGSAVPDHQDATYLYSTPDPKIVGFWIPLEDATERNGCLQFIPGSHRIYPLQSRWIRSKDSSGTIRMEYINCSSSLPSSSSSLKANDSNNLNDEDEKFNNANSIDFEKENRFKLVPAKKGSCILIDGLVIHRSDPNVSDQPRPAYTFHCFDQGKDIESGNRKISKRKWDGLNWLQPTDQYSFPHLYTA
ncbi:hypothetical protein NH340_JMT07362 [Sarcoptes scabiei]|nr:hypothetical protein NH340_JMT07362 [Sarcoptes scabiei]